MNSKGLKFIKLKGFRTLSGWKDLDSMKSFRNNSHHLEAMQNIKEMGKTKSISWESEYEPDWNEAIKQLNKAEF